MKDFVSTFHHMHTHTLDLHDGRASCKKKLRFDCDADNGLLDISEICAKSNAFVNAVRQSIDQINEFTHNDTLCTVDASTSNANSQSLNS